MGDTRPYWKVAVSLLFSILATVLFILTGVKLLIFLIPFVVGWCISSIASPVVNWLEKKLNIMKNLGSVIMVALVIAVIVLIFYYAISRLVIEIGDLIQNFPELYVGFENGLQQIGGTFSGILSRLPQGIRDGWNTMIGNLDEYLGSLAANISEAAVEGAGNFAKNLPSFLVSCVVALISAYFFTVQREEVLAWLRKTAPTAVEKRMELVMDNLRYAVGGYLKAQVKIMAIIFLILAAGFMVLGVNYSLLVAFLVAFLDFLPFFGTGTALIPWALYKFFTTDYRMAILLLVLYVITQAVRQFLQPKLVADSMGMNPLVTLLLLYIGYRLGGVLWMILAVPIGMVLINICQAGAFDYIFDDVKILVNGILELRQDSGKK